jgi:hypothetical protein
MQDSWRITVSPSVALERWTVRIEGPAPEDRSSFDAPVDRLLDELQERLRTVTAGRTAVTGSRLLATYAKAYARTDEAEPIDTTVIEPQQQSAWPSEVLPVVVQTPATRPPSGRPLSRRKAGLPALVALMACAAVLVFGWRSLPARRRAAVPPTVTVVAAKPAPVHDEAPPNAHVAASSTAAVAASPAAVAASLASTLPDAKRVSDVKPLSAPTPGSGPTVGSRAKPVSSDSAAAAPPVTSRWTSSRLASLGVRPEWRGSAIGIHDPLLMKDLQQGLAELWVGRVAAKSDVIFLGVNGEADLAQLATLQKALKQGGVLWTFYRSGDRTSASILAATARSVHLARTRVIPFSQAYEAAAFVALDVVK